MENRNYITSVCTVKNGKVAVNQNAGFEDAALSPVEFIRAAYKNYQLSYPKFYKMDDLCKLAFISSELLLKSNPLADYSKEEIAIVIANRASSLEIDTEHQRTISDRSHYFPSPAVFVYTLPNILVGEIAIRNHIKGENTFFIFDKFDAGFMSSYVNSLLNEGRAKCCITGWVDFYENNYEAILYTVEQKKGILSFENDKLQTEQLFK
ncbi:MAG: 3-oxoacyl-ACP synthase [Bacteroidia bacterium]